MPSQQQPKYPSDQDHCEKEGRSLSSSLFLMQDALVLWNGLWRRILGLPMSLFEERERERSSYFSRNTQ
jgi:hypothetical protein